MCSCFMCAHIQAGRSELFSARSFRDIRRELYAQRLEQRMDDEASDTELDDAINCPRDEGPSHSFNSLPATFVRSSLHSVQ